MVMRWNWDQGVNEGCECGPLFFSSMKQLCGMHRISQIILTIALATALMAGCGPDKKMSDAQSDPAFLLCDSAARLFNSGGDPMAVMALLDSASANNPVFPLIPFNRYKVYLKLGNDSAAIREIEAWGNLVPNNPAPPMLSGILNERVGNDSIARSGYTHALALHRLTLKNHGWRDEKHDRSIIGSAICLYLLNDSVNLAPMLDSIRAFDPNNTIPDDMGQLSRREIIDRLL